MKRILLFMAFLLISVTANAQILKVDKDHSNVGFTVKHLSISSVNGYFNNYDASIELDKNKNPKNILASIDVTSVYTKNSQRDYSLLTGIFFDSANFKNITFRMTSLKGKKMRGILTIRNVSKEIELDYTYNGSAADKDGSAKISFSLTGTINRTEFDVGKNYPLSLISDRTNIAIDIEGSISK